MSNLSKAIAIASNSFEDKFDKGGKPYILHCLWVMNKVRHLGEKYMIVAILHDLIEDTNWQLFELRELGFSEEITCAINAITKRNSEDYLIYLHRVKLNEIATQVKIRDLEHNSKLKRLKGVTQKDINRTIKYQKAYRFLLK